MFLDIFIKYLAKGRKHVRIAEQAVDFAGG